MIVQSIVLPPVVSPCHHRGKHPLVVSILSPLANALAFLGLS